jgi:hypothetical protein
MDEQPLLDAWRRNWKVLPTAFVDNVTFDITIPAELQILSEPWWYLKSVDQDNSVEIEQMTPARWVILFATVMRLRSQCEKGIRFELLCESQGPREIERVREICRRLSKEPT